MSGVLTLKSEVNIKRWGGEKNDFNEVVDDGGGATAYLASGLEQEVILTIDCICGQMQPK